METAIRPSGEGHLLFARFRKAASRCLVALLVTATLLTISTGTPLRILITEIVGMLLIIAGVLGRIWCALYIAGRKNRELCQQGPYSLCRNPLYGFSFLAVVGLLLAARFGALAVLLMPLFWGYHFAVIRAEERTLSAMFGSDYAQYRRNVPRIWPRFSGYRSPPMLTVETRLMIRALSEVAWFLLALAALEIVEHLRGASFGSEALPVLFTWPF